MKACIVYLANNGSEHLLNASLTRTFSFLLPSNPYPVLVFHEPGFQRERVSFPVEFRQIRFQVPAYPPEIACQIKDDLRGFGMGYRHMCRWQAGVVYEHLADYDYYLRLDTDSFLRAPVEYNLFDHMRAGGYLYATLPGTLHLDTEWCVHGLRDTVAHWLRDEQIPTVQPIGEIPHGLMFYNNFELASVRWFREGHYRQMFEVLDRAGGIYLHRWGDAPIHTLGVYLFIPEAQRTELSGVHYMHQWFVC